MGTRNYFRQMELDAEKARREQINRDYNAGFRAAHNGEPLPEDATAAFVTGYKDGESDK